MKTLTTIITCAVVVTVAKFGGSWLGTQTARNNVTAESQASGSPAGVFGTTWLMSASEVKQVASTAVVSGENELLELRNVYGRDAKVIYTFQKDMLVSVLVAFTGVSSPAAYDATQRNLTDQFGLLSAPEKGSDGRLVSGKTTGRFAVQHIFYDLWGIQMEQVLYYRTKQG